MGQLEIFRRQKLEILSHYKRDASMLQQQIDDLQERIEENQGEAKNLQEQMQILEKEKKVRKYVFVSWNSLSVRNTSRFRLSRWRQHKYTCKS